MELRVPFDLRATREWKQSLLIVATDGKNVQGFHLSTFIDGILCRHLVNKHLAAGLIEPSLHTHRKAMLMLTLTHVDEIEHGAEKFQGRPAVVVTAT